MSTPTQPAPGSSGDLGAVIGQSFNLYFGRFRQYIMPALVVVLPAYILNAIINVATFKATWGALSNAPNPLAGAGALGGNFLAGILTGVIQWAAFGLAVGLLVKIVQGSLEGKSVGLGEAFSGVGPVFGNLIVASILFGLAMTVGFALLIIPGLIVGFFFCVVPQAVVIDGQSPFNAFGRAANVVLRAPGEIIVTLVIAFVYMLITGMITGWITLATLFSGGIIIGQVIGGVFSLLMVPWLAAALTLAYLKGKKSLA